MHDLTAKQLLTHRHQSQPGADSFNVLSVLNEQRVVKTQRYIGADVWPPLD